MDYFINIDSIIDVDKTQIREAYDSGVIADLSLVFAEPPEDLGSDDSEFYPENLPPIAVVPAPGNEGKYWIVDGHHRYKAAKNTGKEFVMVDILIPSGFNEPVKDLDDLRYIQASCNGQAFANRTIETRRRQVKAAIKKQTSWVAFQVAKYCHVSVDLVNSVFAEMEAAENLKKPQKPIEKAQAAIADPANAGKSNVQIAKAAGVDERTVRRARQNSDPKNAEVDEVRKNTEPKKYAPQTPEDCWDYQCKVCGNDCNESLEFDWNGDKLYFCCWDCVEEFAKENELEIDDVNFTLLERDFDAQLDKVASKARETIKTPEPDSIPIRDKSNIDSIVDDVLSWLGDRAEIFAVLLRDKIDGN